MTLKEFIHQKSIELGKEVLRMTTGAGSGHPSSGLAIMHIVGTLMYDVMRWSPDDPWNPASDRLILSEGHAVPAVYAVYADLAGVVGRNRASARKLAIADLASLRETDSPLDGHPNPAEGFPFFDAATGSLGQGLSVGAGLALAARLRGLDRRIYVIIGDGESREGQIWEAMDFIADHNLTAVTAIFNCNGQGQADYVSKQQSAEVIAAKAQAFGWHVARLDGHDPEAVKRAIAEAREHSKPSEVVAGTLTTPLSLEGRGSRPLAIVAKTEKGWGCEMLKDKTNHGKPVAADQLAAAIGQLDGMYERLGVARKPQGVPDRYRPAMPAVAAPLRRTPSEPAPFDAAIAEAGLASSVAKGKMATRRAYGVALLALGGADERIVALDGDVCNSTFSEMFAKKYPDRFFECKIAEQNMISTAVGLAASGFVPFVSTFAKFTARAYDQIEMAQITRANIKITGSHAGASLAADGPSQMSLHDVAYFRSASLTEDNSGRAACLSFHPCDAVAAYYCTWLMANHDGMCYMRTHRPDVPIIYSSEARFEIGGSHVLTEGDALTIVSAGYMVHVCREAVRMLEAESIRCTLIDAYSFPLNGKPILSAARQTRGRILCVEDNYLGGLGGAVAEAAAEAGGTRVESMTCRRIPKSARTTDQMMAYLGLSAADVVKRARAALK